MITKDEKYIQRCIQLALNGLGLTYPNPLVGAVIVHNNTIIGEGWHIQSGKSHAEINAINSVKDKSLLKDSEIYVSLEPCSHVGKTPSCALKLAEIGFKRVIIGTTDPNEKVNGEGLQILKNSISNITVGVLEDLCKNLNKRFNTFHLYKRPYIILKWAETLNKKIDNGTNRNEPFRISNKYSLQNTHLLRSYEQSILVGKNTALIDNPYLTSRLISGKNPIRILIDKNLVIPTNYHIFNNEAQTLIFNEKKNYTSNHLEYIQIDFSKSLPKQISNELYLRNIQSIIIEGGRKTLQDFIDEKIWDEAIITTSNVMVKNGTNAPEIFGNITNQKYIGDNLTTYLNIV